ncbi:MAG: peptidoglycan-binding protein [Rhodospirillaceae bacterium]|nr:peptidoglycan-binding protein [Rhodospirillaceae bacterium]
MQTTGNRIAAIFGAALAALAATLAATQAAAQPAGYEGFAGVWHENDWQSIDIGPDTVTFIDGGDRWEMDPTTCPNLFEHEFSSRTRAEFVEFLALDRPASEGGLTDHGGAPMADRILAEWPEGHGPVATLWSYCFAETHGGTLYFLTDEDDLTGIRYGEGIAEIVQYSRAVPPPSHDVLSDYERLEIQSALQRLSLYGGPVDAVFGPATAAAIRAYQESLGEEATGILTRSQIVRLVYGG